MKSKSRKNYLKIESEEIKFLRKITSWNVSKSFEVIILDAIVISNKKKCDLTIYINLFNNIIYYLPR